MPFQLHDLVMTIRVVAALHAVGPIGRGRDVRFTRLWTESSGDTPQNLMESGSGMIDKLTDMDHYLTITQAEHRIYTVYSR